MRLILFSPFQLPGRAAAVLRAGHGAARPVHRVRPRLRGEGRLPAARLCGVRGLRGRGRARDGDQQ